MSINPVYLFKGAINKYNNHKLMVTLFDLVKVASVFIKIPFLSHKVTASDSFIIIVPL